MTTSWIALFDTNIGVLDWIGTAASHAAAIREFLRDVGFNSEIEHFFRAVDVTDEQAAALLAWAENPTAYDYPEDLSPGDIYDHDDVVRIMAA